MDILLILALIVFVGMFAAWLVLPGTAATGVVNQDVMEVATAPTSA